MTRYAIIRDGVLLDWTIRKLRRQAIHAAEEHTCIPWPKLRDVHHCWAARVEVRIQSTADNAGHKRARR